MPHRDSDPATLYATLQQVDPVMASRWHPNDHRKVHRSLAIYYTTGQRASDIYAAQAAESSTSSTSPYNNLLFWVHAETDPLRDRLDRRVDKMLSSGMREEIAQMRAVYDSAVKSGEKVDVEHGIWQSIGFKEFLKWGCYGDSTASTAIAPQAEAQKLEGEQEDEKTKPELGLKNKEQEALREMKTATRQYAKYQIRWIRTKFWRLLKAPEDGGEKKLFVLDSTDVERYDQNVVVPAMDIAKRRTLSIELL